MSNKINQKLGLRPNTRKRALMKDAGKDAAAAARTSALCPCGHRWIVRNIARNRTLCAWCGRFEPPIEVRA